MKSAQYSQYGDSNVITINEVNKPAAKVGQVLVEVSAAAINPFDWKLRQGIFKDMIPVKFPVTIGADFSGVITEVGEDVSEYQAGDAVYGSAIVLNGGSGSIAEFALANIGNIANKPKNADFKKAAALVLVGVSAIQALNEHINLSSGQKILIQGGAGGIGSVAIQYAKHLGAYVATTVQGADVEFVRDLGADEVINYETEDFTKILSDYDAVFDTVGGEVYKKSYMVLKSGGIIVSMVEQPDEKLMAQYNVTAIAQQSQTDTATLKKLSKLVEEGVIAAQIDRQFSFAQTVEAFQYAEESHHRGKVIIAIKE